MTVNTNVRYVGPARDYSGYGEAVRHDIAALVAAGVDVTTTIPAYTMEIADFGKLGLIAAERQNKNIEYDKIILHTTPNVYKQFMESGKYHIGRFFWETDKVPEEFAINLELCNEIWTGSDYNKRAIEKAGVTKPIYIIPEAIDTSVKPEDFQPYTAVNTDKFNFYSLFEWTERKNPWALLSAYWQEFEHTEDVSLTIKTYVDNFTPDKRSEIDECIRKIKAALNLKRYAPVYLYRNLMDRNQVYRFHRTYDVFVSAHRGEGWGIPQMEALLMQKPVISTNCGGIHEYLTTGKEGIFIDYTLTPLTENTRNSHWYTQDQQWASIEPTALRMAMRAVYEKRELAAELGKNGAQTVKDRFSFDVVGSIMRDRLLQIDSH